MVNKVLDCLTISLFDRFGDTFTYYVDDVEQKVVRPCFRVSTLKPTFRSCAPNLYERFVPIVIYYFPKLDAETSVTKDINSVDELLMEELEYLKVGSLLLRGAQIESKIIENVLLFHVNYRFNTTYEIEKEFMESQTYNGKIIE